MQSNIFGKLSFFQNQPVDSDNDIAVYGVIKNRRVVRYINQKFIDKQSKNLYKYKILISKSSGSGIFGEALSEPILLKPQEAYTYTFIGIGNFDTQVEAENAIKYIKSKFARAMLNVLKVTQDNTPEKWRCVPLQDFTPKSDIDWTQSISNIDQQLYHKYGLTNSEIEFLEENVKPMG